MITHYKGERRNDKSRKAQQRKRDKTWAKEVLRHEEAYATQYVDLAREILGRR